jgi:hypothetical protein
MRFDPTINCMHYGCEEKKQLHAVFTRCAWIMAAYSGGAGNVPTIIKAFPFDI